MKKLFLSSFFTDVSRLFPEIMNNEHKGKKVTFIPTAANPEKVRFFVDSDKKALQRIGLIVDETDIANCSKEEISVKLNENDYIFICGGNTFYLLQELKRKKIDSLIVQHINNGKPYIGSSAGSIILSKNIGYVSRMDSPKKAPELTDYDALGVTDFYILPHYTNAPFKKITQKIIEEYESKLDLRPISNDQVIIVNGHKAELKTDKKD